MANETFSNIEVKVKGYLRTALSAEASTTTIDVDFVNEDDPSTAIELQSDTLMFEIDPLNKTGKESEICLATSNAADTPVSDRTRFSTVTRGLPKEGHEQTGSATRANSWDEGTEVAIATGSMAKMVNLMVKEHKLIYPTNGASIQAPVYANATARDAAVTSPANGMYIYNTAEGVMQKYEGGAWVNSGTATTVNASTTAAGKVELATQAELDAGTATGDTGASIVATPSTIAEVVQQSTWSYKADAEASDAYAVTLAPAIDAYVEGLKVIFKANTINTGACTINVNAKGAKSIYKNDDEELEDGDIQAGQIVEVVYDGTQFQLVSPTAGQLSTASASTLTDGSDASSLHTHSPLVLLRNTNASFVSCNGGDGVTSGAGDESVTHYGGLTKLVSGATADRYAGCGIDTNLGHFGGSFDSNTPSAFFSVRFSDTTSQDGFIGFGGQQQRVATDAALTTDHAGFLIDDGDLYASVADGDTQDKSDAITGITLTDRNNYYIDVSGSNYRFYVNNVLKWTSTSNEPNSGIYSASCCIKTRENSDKELIFAGWVSINL